MENEIKTLLTTGLQEGFAGGTTMNKVVRGGFPLASSHFENEFGTYHDEWFADRAGAGQEIVKSGDTTFTRVYAGGTLPLIDLQTLGISKKDVMTFLIKQITEHGDKLRLFENFEPEPEGDWQYSYTILHTNPSVPLTIGIEKISYEGTCVFEHDFILCPVD